MKKTLLAAVLALLLGACATSGDTTAATAEDAAQAIAAAEAARAKASAVGYEWRDTGEIIEAAKKAAEAKQYSEAVKLAGKAERQGINAVKQHDQQEAALK